MKIHEAVELSISRFFQRVPLWERVASLWGWWMFRRLFLYGSCVYVAETLLGHRRRPLGSTPIRLFPVESWFPKALDKDVDEESRAFLETVGYPVLETQKNEMCSSEPITFYSEVKLPVTINPLPDDEPEPPVGGEIYPPGFFTFMQTLSVFGHFNIEDGVKIWKSSEFKTLQPDELLFDFGDADDSFYIVMSGSVAICIYDEDFGLTRIKSAKANENIISLISVLDFVTQTAAYPKPAQAYAEEISVICQTSFNVFLEHFNHRPQNLNAFIRQLMTKVRKLYFEGLHEVAALNVHILKQSMQQSQYQDFDVLIGEHGAEEMAKDVLAGIRKYLPLEEKDLKDCWFGEIEEGTVVTRIGLPVLNLVYIHRGELAAVLESALNKLCIESVRKIKFAKYAHEDQILCYFGQESLVGSWGLLSSYTSFYTLKVPKGQKAIILEIPGHIVDRIWNQQPRTLFPFVKKQLACLSEASRQMDFCMDWKIVAPGRVVYRRGDPRIATFLIISGRLRYRVYATHKRSKRLEMDAKSTYGNYESGDWFGFVECVVAANSMQKTVVADRYSEVVVLPAELITLLYQKYPHITASMVTYLAFRIHKDYNYDEINPRKDQNATDILSHPQYAATKTPSTSILAVFPLIKDIPGDLYCQEVCRHYPRKGTYLNFDHFKEHVNHSEARINLSELIHWLCTYQDSYSSRFIVLLGNVGNVDLWNTIIARQADFIQILVTQDCSLDLYKVEEMVQIEGWKAVKDLMFLHPAGILPENKNRGWRSNLAAPLPRGSAKWLIKRPWLDTHHHARFPRCAFEFMKTLEAKHLKEFEDYMKTRVDKHSDIARLCRWFSNSMIGLVLGGGGAKGAAQLGFFEYLREIDIPIDYVCGVSIGSFIGALFSIHQDLPPIEERVRRLLKELETPSKYMSDATIPYSSVFRGRSFDEFVQNSFNDVRIEDVWVPYFCVTTDITGCHSRVHRHGVMWFYVRGSMTLTMIFPPVINHRDQHLLMDGGYSDILPGNHLRSAGVRYILAVDIGDQNGIPLFNIGYECSGIKCMIQYLMPVNHWPTIPTRFAFWEQLNYIAARKYVDLLSKMDRRVIVVRPAVEFYSGKDFKKVDEMRMMGYYTTKRRFSGIRRGLSVAMMWTLLQMYDPDVNIHPDQSRNVEEKSEKFLGQQVGKHF